MKTFLPLLLSVVIVFSSMSMMAQNTINPEKGYSPQIGATVAMLNDLKRRVVNSVRSLNQEKTDFLLDKDANRVGALILHLAATEAYYQVYTFQGRGFNTEEAAKWDTALNLGDDARADLKDKPISYYLDIWEEVRAETLRLLKTKDDKWFKRKVEQGSMNNHWAWYHVMEHQANHMGQIRFLIKRMPE